MAHDGQELFIKIAKGFSRYTLRSIVQNGNSVVVNLHVHAPGREDYMFRVQVVCKDGFDFDDYARIAVRAHGNRYDPTLTQTTADSSLLSAFAVRDQQLVLKDVLALLCSARLYGIGRMPGFLYGLAVLANVDGTKEQIFNALDLLIEPTPMMSNGPPAPVDRIDEIRNVFRASRPMLSTTFTNSGMA